MDNAAMMIFGALCGLALAAAWDWWTSRGL